MFEINNEVETKEETSQDFRSLGELQLALVGGGMGDATLC